jgi:ankyrin repeat protein
VLGGTLTDQLDVTELLLAHKADIHAQNHVKVTPLIAATSRGLKRVADLLRKYGSG